MKKSINQMKQELGPKKTVKAYKLFRVHPDHPGKLFPLFIGAKKPVEMGKWTPAENIPTSGFADRPGWHAGELPVATHIGEKSDPKNMVKKPPDRRPHNQAWAEVEMPHDVDWQSEANKRGTNAKGKVIAAKAHITDEIPVGGHYRYKTNSNMTGSWLIGGSLKVNKVLTDDEVSQINKKAGVADLPRTKPFNMKEYGFKEGGLVSAEERKANLAKLLEHSHVNKADGGTIEGKAIPSISQMKMALLRQRVGKLAANTPPTLSPMTDRLRPIIRYGDDRADEYLDFLWRLRNKEVAFHVSPDSNLTKIEGVGGMANPVSKFGGLFGGSLSNVLSNGYGGKSPTVYELSALRKDIAEQRNLRVIENPTAILKKFADPAYKSKLSGSKLDDLYDVVTRESSAEDIDQLRKRLGVSGILADEFNWDIQRLRGALARSGGYKAVTTDDEIGSLLFLPGSTLKKSIIQPK